MCGIFASIHSCESLETLRSGFDSIQHRGPDQSVLMEVKDTIIGFHRLSINDLSEKGNQPLSLPGSNVLLICNGEIYNHQMLTDIYHFQRYSQSDCEIILHLYLRFGMERTLHELDGYFAFVLIDGDNIFVARDPIGVRSLYFGTKEKTVYFASELKAIHPYATEIKHFPPGHYWNQGVCTSYCDLYSNDVYYDDYQLTMDTTRELLLQAVRKRVDNTERPIGCLLSGGLDSSLITAMVVQFSKVPIHTFSIGLEGSTDLAFAKKVADHLHTIHHEVIVTEKEMLEAIPEVIRQIESYDTTTVRASTPMYLLSKYISTHTDIKVIFSGEGSDELSGSYLYFQKAPTEEEFQKECLRLTKDLYYFDVLRCDKSISAHGLEARVPFLDQSFIEYYLHINPYFKKYTQNRCEKYLLRQAFRDLLPKEVLWRSKEAFSDGVSHKERSWYQIIQEYTESMSFDQTYTYLPPLLKESMWYRNIFESYYPQRQEIVPYYWLPRWCGNTIDPSARTLTNYTC